MLHFVTNKIFHLIDEFKREMFPSWWSSEHKIKETGAELVKEIFDKIIKNNGEKICSHKITQAN